MQRKRPCSLTGIYFRYSEIFQAPSKLVTDSRSYVSVTAARSTNIPIDPSVYFQQELSGSTAHTKALIIINETTPQIPSKTKNWIVLIRVAPKVNLQRHSINEGHIINDIISTISSYPSHDKSLLAFFNAIHCGTAQLNILQKSNESLHRFMNMLNNSNAN